MTQGHYGPRSGTSDAGQCHQSLRIIRQAAGEIAGDNLCGPVHIPRPGIISQPRPEMQHPVQGSIGQGDRVRKPFNKADEIRYYGLHLGLLQHDLGHPDTIGTGVLLPGEIMPAMLSEPGQNCGGKFRHRHSARIFDIWDIWGQSKIHRDLYSNHRYQMNFTLTPNIKPNSYHISSLWAPAARLSILRMLSFASVTILRFRKNGPIAGGTQKSGWSWKL